MTDCEMVERGGMFPLDQSCTPTDEDLKQWLWAPHPLHLSQAIDKASSARAELSARAVTLLEAARLDQAIPVPNNQAQKE